MRKVQTTYETETIGARLARFVLLAVTLFCIGGGAVVASRFSTETLSLIVGLLLAGVPLLAVVGLLFFVLIRQGRRRNEPQQMTIPPIIMQIPQASQNALPGDGGLWDFGAPRQTVTARAWDVIGDED